MSFEINFEPIGRRYKSEEPITLLDAARQSGIGIRTVCGGKQTCGKCRIRLLGQDIPPVTEGEKKHLSSREIEEGYRLACAVTVTNHVDVYIPQSSLTEKQKLGIMGREFYIEVDPLVKKLEVSLEEATLDDVRSDERRLKEFLLAEYGLGGISADVETLKTLTPTLRQNKWKADIALWDKEIVFVGPPSGGEQAHGVSVDLGTTKIALYLVDLVSGETIDADGFMNPQIAYGEDVMSRIMSAMTDPQNALRMQEEVVSTLNKSIEDLCHRNDLSPEEILEMTLVGNTAMHHLFLGFPTRQLALSPFVPVTDEPIDIKARDLGLKISPGAYVHVLPIIAGFVGADHVAMLLASGIVDQGEKAIGIDIGTNTEIALVIDDKIVSCSTASGPAFEGAHIRYGMRAAAGAIERVTIDPQTYEVKVMTIEDKPPVGICGSGVLDAIAEMLKTGVLDERGKLVREIPGVRRDKESGIYEFILVSKDRTEIEDDIVITQKDVVAIQLAKGAIRAGMNILLDQMKIRPEELEKVVIAGAFGMYIDPLNAIEIGMFPQLPLDRFLQVGNAAGVGAKMALISKRHRQKAVEIARRTNYLELTVVPDFAGKFAYAMQFKT